MTTEVAWESGDRLSREVWTVDYDTLRGTLRIIRYEKQTRKTPRHKWVIAGLNSGWSAFGNRSYWEGYGLTAADVPWNSTLQCFLAEKIANDIRNMEMRIG